MAHALGENPRRQAAASASNGSYHTVRQSSVKLANRHNLARAVLCMRRFAQKRAGFQFLDSYFRRR